MMRQRIKINYIEVHHHVKVTRRHSFPTFTKHSTNELASYFLAYLYKTLVFRCQSINFTLFFIQISFQLLSNILKTFEVQHGIRISFARY